MLQKNLDNLFKWADASNMKFNANKFELLLCGKEQEIKIKEFFINSFSNVNDKNNEF